MDNKRLTEMIQQELAKVFSEAKKTIKLKTDLDIGGKGTKPFSDTKEMTLKKGTKYNVTQQNGSMGTLFQFFDIKTGKQLGSKWIDSLKPYGVYESMNEAKSKLEKEFGQYKSFTLKGKEYSISKIEDYGKYVMIKTSNGKYFGSDTLLKMGAIFNPKTKAPRVAWNKGQKTTSKKDYLKILKGAMKDASGMGQGEFTHDMAQSMIYDTEIQSYLNKAYPGFGGNKRKMLQRLQWDLEMFSEVINKMGNAVNEAKKPPTDATIKPHMSQYSVADDPYDVADEIGKEYGWNQSQIEKAEVLIRKKYIRESVNEGKKYKVSDFKVGDKVIITRHGNRNSGIVKKVTKAPNNLVYVSWNPKRPDDESQAFHADELIPESVNEGKKILKDREGNKDTGNKIIDSYLKGMRQGTIQIAWNMISVRGGVVDFTNNIDFTVAFDNSKNQYMVMGDKFKTVTKSASAIKNHNDLHKLIAAAVNGGAFTESVNEALPTKEIDPNQFPNPLPANKKGFLKKGDPKNDKATVDDDVVPTKPVEIAVSKLKPSQDAIYLGKSLAMAIKGIEGGDLGAVISKDNYILDGHHRYAATSFNNPAASVGGVQAQLNIGDLIPVLRAAGDAMKNKRGVEPKGGDVNIFKATMDDVKNVIYKGKNVPTQYYNKEKSIAWFEGIGEATIAKRLKQIQSKRPPSGAPMRKDMPKITPGQVSLIKNLLNKGKIDVRAPYAESVNNNTLNRIINEEVDRFVSQIISKK